MGYVVVGSVLAVSAWLLAKLQPPVRRDRWDHGYDFTMAHRRMLPFLTWAGVLMAAAGVVMLVVDAASG